MEEFKADVKKKDRFGRNALTLSVRYDREIEAYLNQKPTKKSKK